MLIAHEVAGATVKSPRNVHSALFAQVDFALHRFDEVK